MQAARGIKKTRRVAVGALLLFGLEATAAQAAIDASTSEPAAPWTSLDADDAAQDFHFVIVSDRTGGARPGVFESAIPKVNLLQPAFVVSIGDLIEGYTEDQAQLDHEWGEFEDIVAGLDAPFFYVAGNHDMNNAVMAETWRARFGPSYYRFVYKDVLFLVLNSELFGMVTEPETPVPGPWTQAEQLAFVERALAEHPAPRWTIVLVHQPLWDYPGGPRGDWPKVEAMLGERDYTVFAGHFHRYVKNVRQDRKFITLATTGGGSSLRGSIYGEFDHVAWVTMTGDGPRIANLMLDGIHDENVVTSASQRAIMSLVGAGVRGDPFVRSLPVFGDGPVFERGLASFEATNAGIAELTLAFNVDPGPHLRYDGAPSTLTLAPGEARRIDLPIVAEPPVPFADLAPGRVEWALRTQAAGEQVRLKLASGLLPVTRHALPAGTATVDGDLGDWPALPFKALRQGDVASKPTAATDVSFAFGLRESAGDLYFAARVVDDSLVASPTLGADVQDALVLFADARPEPERSANVLLYPATRRGHLASMAMARMTLAEAAADRTAEQLAESFAAVQWKTRRTPSGYVAEAMISGDFLSEQAGEPWRTVRISLAAVDWDDGEIANRIPWHVRGSSASALHWQPNRFGDAPVAGTGTFVRNSTR